MQELESKSRVVKLAALAKKLDENIMLKYKLLYADKFCLKNICRNLLTDPKFF